MSDSSVAKRYARALLEIAREKDALEDYVKDLNAINSVIRSHPTFHKLLVHPGIAIEKKKDMINHIFADSVAPEVLSLIYLLLKRRREEILPVLTETFVAMANAARNIVNATLYTAYPMNEQDIDAISGKFGGSIGKTIRMHNEVDDSLIGGLLIRIGDRLFDGSIKGKLNRFKAGLNQSHS